jgi:ribosomal protein L16 Arg81 hydroxylase
MDSRSDSESSWLAALIAPVSPDEFLSRYWSRQPLFCRGSADRFATLLSWTVLNELLAHHWREPRRFRLARQGRDIDPASYSDVAGAHARIRARDVTDQLRRGATLSFDAIDELHEPLTRLSESFETFFRSDTQVNLYAAWRALHGLDLHCDDQEVFILHLEGRKRWLLYGAIVDGVDRMGLSSTIVPPAGASLDQVLEPGDLLYIPRGCYHIAVPMNEPALHLTVGVKTPRGIDLLLWIVNRLRTNEMADRGLPLFAPPAERLRYSEELRRALLDGLSSDLVEQYFCESGGNAKTRPSFNLPWSATAEGLPAGSDFLVRLKNRSRVVATGGPDGEAIEVRCRGRRCRFPRSMQWIIEQLDEKTPRPISHLMGAVAGRLDEDMVRTLVGMLLKHDLIAIHERP